MGRKCAVPHCYTGYRKCKEKASLYKVPDDDFFLNKWQEAIAREDRPITPKDYVCEKHFKEDDIQRTRVIKNVVVCMNYCQQNFLLKQVYNYNEYFRKFI